MMRSITAVFENDKVSPQYDFIADQKDGCGYTAGWIGFCTKYGDLLDVVEAYNTAKPGDHPLRSYTSALRRLADDRTDDVGPLGSKFTKAWKDAAADQAFRRVQVEVGQRNYLEPALRIARSKGITTALGLENLFDTALMMGPSATACDGVLKISAQTDKALRGNPASGVPEADWLRRFNQIRIKRLKKPCTPGRQADWPRATGRPEALQELADRGNWALTPPVSIGHGHDLTITEQTIAAELS
jgi:chitosanase